MHIESRRTASLLMLLAVLGPLPHILLLAETVENASVAPTPVLRSWKGDYVVFSKLYGTNTLPDSADRKVVVLNFMGLNCPPCEIGLPIFLDIVRPLVEVSPETFAYYLVAVDSLSVKDTLLAYLEKKGIDPDKEVLLDPYKKAASSFGVKGIPRTFVISPEGHIVTDIEGVVDGYREKLSEAIAHALGAEEQEVLFDD